MDRPESLCLPQLASAQPTDSPQPVCSLCGTQKSKLVWVRGLWGNLGTPWVQGPVYLLGSGQQVVPFLEQPFLIPS